MAEELTRKQLQEQLDAANAQLAALKAQPAAAPSDEKLERDLAAARAELASIKAAAPAGAPLGPAPRYIPYRGKVQATEDCHIGGRFRMGPLNPNNGSGKGDVFEVDVPVLWSDDPYVPVIASEETAPGVYKVEPHPTAVRVDFRFRLQGKADTEIQPLRANAF